MNSQRTLVLFLIIIALLGSACSGNLLPEQSEMTARTGIIPERTTTEQSEQVEPTTPAPPALPTALVDFRVQAPDDTPTTDSINLTILDEVTGLYLNAQSYRMELDENTGIFSTQLPVALGSVVKYRYERQGDQMLVAEHTSGGQPVRYRMLVVNGPTSTDDVISRWTDSEYLFPSGRIMGQASDAVSGQPIPNLLITAGGAQTFSTADGSFLIEGLPPGIHNLVGYALDGSYVPFQQGAEIAADATTPTPIQLNPTQFVNVTFLVTPPSNTPPVVPLRLAGNLYQLGNTFGTLTGGVSTLATRMPVLSPLPDGRYQISLQLPAGTDLRYKYTLGDGYWNAEHIANGEFLLRQIIIPNNDITIEDRVETWETNPGGSITFDITVPPETPTGDFVSIQLNPLFGWTEPVPMWSLGENRWAYVLYGPLNLPGNLSYRYCRNNQCGTADDAATPGLYGQGKNINLEQLPQLIKESVTAWADFGQPVDPASIPDAEVTPRTPEFVAGIEFLPAYHPSWQPLLPPTLQRIKSSSASWQIYDPTWSVTRANPPVFEPVSGRDSLWPDMVDSVQKAHELGLKVAIKPVLSYSGISLPACIELPCPTAVDAWWQEAARDFSWWLVWFDHYRTFLLHHADLAARSGAEALILGGDWLTPTLPGGLLSDGQPSGALTDAETRWRSLLSEVRQHYQGTLIWALPYQEGLSTPSFLDAVDQIYLELSVDPADLEGAPIDPDALAEQIGAQLDGKVSEIATQTGKPVILAFDSPSDPGLEDQQATYEALLNAVNQRDWIAGLVSRGYYPPAELQDKTSSVHGKPAELLLQEWFNGFAANEP